jgi:hypothetical protein
MTAAKKGAHGFAFSEKILSNVHDKCDSGVLSADTLVT